MQADINFGSMTQRTLLAIVGICGILSFGSMPLFGQWGNGVRVVRSDVAGMELEITPDVTWTTLPSGELLPDVEGGGFGNRNAPGSPIEVLMSIPVGLPQPAGTRFEVLNLEYGSPVSGRIAPVPRLVRSEGDITTERYVPDENAYAAYVPDMPAAEFVYKGVAAGLHVGEIRVSPVKYIAGSNRIEVLRRIRVRVTYAGSGTLPSRARVDAGDQALLRASYINGDLADRWQRAPVRSLSSLSKSSGVTAARALLRVETSGDGIYEIRAEDFQNAGIDPGSITNVAVYGGRGIPLPEDFDSAAENRMNNVPAIVERSGNRVSRVLFFGAGTLGWEYESDSENDSVPRRLNNPYVKNRSYIVAVDGEATRQFDLRNTDGAPTVYPSYGIGRMVFEEELTNAIAQGNSGNGGGRDWFGASFGVDEFRLQEKRVFTRELFGLDRTYPVTYRVRFGNFALNVGSGLAQVEQNGTVLGPEFVVPWQGGRDYQTANVTERVYVTDAGLVPADNRSLLGINYRNFGNATGYLDWYEIHYGRKLQAQDNRLLFESPTGVGIAEYRVTGFTTSDLICLDITDPINPIRILPGSTSGGEFVFKDAISPDPQQRRRYYIGPLNDARRVSNVSKPHYADLRNKDLSVDILVITHEDLREAAQEYVDYRNGRGELTAGYVTTEEIYTEYSSGNLDPTAIRDYVFQAYHSWSKRPKYLLLLGDGHYDFRGLTASQKQLVPVYEEGGDRNSYNDIDVSAFDDYYVRIDNDDDLIDMRVGRIAVDNVEDALTVIDKIRRYESSQSFGDWRRRVVLVADDSWPIGEGGGFVPQSEELDRDYLPQWIEAEKIYLPEYPTVQTVQRSKPGATQDLVQWLNRGALLVNWVGHGNARVWGHEHVLEKDEFIPRLTNDTALTLVIAVTCNFGRFDNPTEVSGSELFMQHRGGGAVAVLATTRAVYIDDNERLMDAYFSRLFLRDANGSFLPLGDAMFAAKTRQGASASNDEKYVLFGDPSMRLNLPLDSVQITAINDVEIADDTVTVGALSVVKVDGVIRDRQGEIREDFNGTAIVSLYDADQYRTIEDVDRTADVVDRGGQLFRGPTIVENGRFSMSFRVPKDIAFDSTTGRVFAYAFSETEDAAGGTAHIRVFGSSDEPITDFDGPDIELFVDDRTFRSGDVVTPTPMLIVDLNDASGINASGAGLGHRIEAWIGDNPNPINLTEFYTTSATDYRQGSAERELIDLEPGEYKVRVRAWDIFNNPAETDAYFRIVEGEADELVVTDVLNYPNPMGRNTDFLFRHNQSRPLDVKIDIYSAAGRKIRTLESHNVTDRFVRVPWDGHDRDGDRVANGVYFYRLRVTVAGGGSGEGEQSVEIIEKVAVAR